MADDQPRLPTLTAEQRDALYGQVLDHLGGIDDLRLAFERKDFEAADRLARQFNDMLRLILTDLGWGDSSQGSIQLTTPAPVLRRVLAIQRRRATEQLAAERPELEELQAMTGRAKFVLSACEQVLSDLDKCHSGANAEGTHGEVQAR